MITKERLEQLIKENATIYYADRDVKFPIPIFLNEEDFVKENELSHEESCIRDNILLEDLYEEQKQAEWYLKYHKNRIETLDLPMWEDFIKEDNFVFKFYVKKKEYSMYIFVKNKNTNNCRILIRADDREQDWLVFEEPATEENYIKACDLCLKLFKGEEK